MKYQNRVVIYIDILGFKNIIDNTIDEEGNDDEIKIDSIKELYDIIRDIWYLDKSKGGFPTSLKKKSKRITIFSDSIVISFKSDELSAVFYSILEVKWMLMRLVTKGIVCRGAISFGKLVHTSKMIFGPALVEAYTLEQKSALYPRIILEKSIIELGARWGLNLPDDEKKFIESMLMKDSDGMYYIDYFEKVQTEFDEPLYEYPDYIETLSSIIRSKLGSSNTPPDIKIKYYWMMEKFNALVSKVNSDSLIEDLENNGEFEIANFYRSLDKIIP